MIMHDLKNNSFDVSTLKLIIWDLDETFWEGTLSEGAVHIPPSHAQLVRALCYKGIMNSICSKNDYAAVEKAFSVEKGLWDFFVFPSIDWTPKGQRIKQLIQNMQLRAENVLLIDDNLGNLQEATFYCPTLKVALPSVIEELEQELPKVQKDDSSLSRLQQYKILEIKHKAQEKVSSNTEFLEQSDIQVVLHHDCLSQRERILEMIHRTNQLNYTKKRSTAEELFNVLSSPAYECAYVSVKDKYGDYGIVGFYAKNIQTNSLEHFLFSCRILGMGVDQFIYQELNFPQITISGSVTGKLCDKKTVSWINLSKADSHQQTQHQKEFSILMKGPCDLESCVPYMDMAGCHIDKEFIHLNSNAPDSIGQQCTENIVNAHKYSEKIKEQAVKETPFAAPDDFFTRLFSNTYDAVVLSTLLDSVIGVYENKQYGYHVCGGWAEFPFTDKNHWDTLLESKNIHSHIPSLNIPITLPVLKDITERYRFLGPVSPENCVSNLNYIYTLLPRKTLLILILGAEKPCEHEEYPAYKHAHLRHRERNRLIEAFAAGKENIRLIKLDDFITSQSDFVDCVDHYTRKVYWQLAVRIMEEINQYKKISLQANTNFIIKKYAKSCIRYWRKKCFYSFLGLFVNQERKKQYAEALLPVKTEYDSFRELFRGIVSKNKK